MGPTTRCSAPSSWTDGRGIGRGAVRALPPRWRVSTQNPLLPRKARRTAVQVAFIPFVSILLLPIVLVRYRNVTSQGIASGLGFLERTIGWLIARLVIEVSSRPPVAGCSSRGSCTRPSSGSCLVPRQPAGVRRRPAAPFRQQAHGSGRHHSCRGRPERPGHPCRSATKGGPRRGLDGLGRLRLRGRCGGLPACQHPPGASDPRRPLSQRRATALDGLLPRGGRDHRVFLAHGILERPAPIALRLARFGALVLLMHGGVAGLPVVSRSNGATRR